MLHTTPMGTITGTATEIPTLLEAGVDMEATEEEEATGAAMISMVVARVVLGAELLVEAREVESRPEVVEEVREVEVAVEEVVKVVEDQDMNHTSTDLMMMKQCLNVKQLFQSLK